MIYSPAGNVGSEDRIHAAGPSTLEGQRLVVLDNGKPNAAYLMQTAAEVLARRTGLVAIGVRAKGSAATPIEEDLLDSICKEADLALTGTAD
jgi:hypothetical protein